ncbi:MAG: uroporphyrinogen decarboxylase family protein [Armatimonadota bacterium]
MAKPMTSRERFHETFHYGTPDRVFMHPQWVFGETRERWYTEGLPRDVHFNTYFGFDRMEMAPVNFSPWPALETNVVEKGENWDIVEDELGGRLKRWNDREIGMSQWITYPVRGREQWEILKQRLNADDPIRYPEYWADYKRAVKDRDYPLGIHGGSYYGWIRNWVGMEHLALWYMDHPDLIHEMTEFISDFMLKLLERALTEMDFDYALLWEDMCYKAGPLISPAAFREYMIDPMKRVTSRLREAGIDIIMVDCDGQIDALLPLWLEAGVNLHYPLEVASECDPLKYREIYGKDLLFRGAIDKRIMRDGCTKADVEREVLSKVPEMWRQGGYGPFVDHAVPPDVPLELFKYYVDMVNDICRS